jgi:hypothetical protein
MNYNNDQPEFLTKEAVKIVNKRFDITEKQYHQLLDIEDMLKIPPSAIVRISLDTFLPKMKDNYFRYAGIKEVWDQRKF